MNNSSRSHNSTMKRLRELIVAVSLLLPLPALADQSTINVKANNGNQAGEVDLNPNTAVQIRLNYFKRFIRASWASPTQMRQPTPWIGFGADDVDNVRNQYPIWEERTHYSQGGNGGNGGRNSDQSDIPELPNDETDSNNEVDQPEPDVRIHKSQVWDPRINDPPERILVYDCLWADRGGGLFLPPADDFPGPEVPSAGPPIPGEPMGYANIPKPKSPGVGCYMQPKLFAFDLPLLRRDRELFIDHMVTWGQPCSDTQFQIIDRENKQRFLELFFDPERWNWLGQCVTMMQGIGAANQLAGAAETSYGAAFNCAYSGQEGNGAANGASAPGGSGQAGTLINIANEQSGVPTAANNPQKTIPQAVWMVQQMYKQCYIPLAILFLLPGAVITQVKSQVSGGFNIENVQSPFEGIIRSIVAIFLIPATQVIVSYSIDVGNSMAYSCKDWVDLPTIFKWAHNVTYNTKVNNIDNTIEPPQGRLGTEEQGDDPLDGTSDQQGRGRQDGMATVNMVVNYGPHGRGWGDNDAERVTVQEEQTWLSEVGEVLFNMANYLFATFVIILGGYQLVLMCYLFLLGPLAAAFYAWPSMPSKNGLFQGVFGNWVNGVISCSLWRFYWMVILLVMTQRILYIKDTDGGFPLDPGISTVQWETAIFTCLLGLMFWVPFNPWNFDPAQAFDGATQAGSNMMGQGGTGPNAGLVGAAQQAALAGGANPADVNRAVQQITEASGRVGGIGSAMSAMTSSVPTSGSGGLPGLGRMMEERNNPNPQGRGLTSPPPLGVSPPPGGRGGVAPPVLPGGGLPAGGGGGPMRLFNSLIPGFSATRLASGAGADLEPPGGLDGDTAPHSPAFIVNPNFGGNRRQLVSGLGGLRGHQPIAPGIPSVPAGLDSNDGPPMTV